MSYVQSAAADEEFEHLFSERDEEVTTAMSPEEYLKALRYRTNADETALTTRSVSLYCDRMFSYR